MRLFRWPESHRCGWDGERLIFFLCAVYPYIFGRYFLAKKIKYLLFSSHCSSYHSKCRLPNLYYSTDCWTAFRQTTAPYSNHRPDLKTKMNQNFLPTMIKALSVSLFLSVPFFLFWWDNAGGRGGEAVTTGNEPPGGQIHEIVTATNDTSTSQFR